MPMPQHQIVSCRLVYRLDNWPVPVFDHSVCLWMVHRHLYIRNLVSLEQRADDRLHLRPTVQTDDSNPARLTNNVVV